MMATYTELGAVVTMREAAGLTGVSRATAHRHDAAAEPTLSSVRPAPANRLDDGERARIVNKPPNQPPSPPRPGSTSHQAERWGNEDSQTTQSMNP
jgi:hypothetical protein